MAEHVQNCHVDYLAFTIRAPEGMKFEDQRQHVLWLIRHVFGPVTVEDTGKGWRGYTDCYKFANEARVCFGGDKNNNTIHFDIPGDACSMIADWNRLADFLDDYPAKLTRLDVAHDDFQGETLSIEWARTQYQTGGFKPARGISPSASMVSDEGSGKGCTYYVGSRQSGKMARIYEKGKQLGDPFSTWVRFEVEWHAVHRELPINMLRDPSSYLAQSYPCASFISGRRSWVKTIAFKAAATLEKAKEHVKKQGGSAIRALRELGHSDSEIVAELIRPEMTPRLAVNVAALKAYRSAEKPNRAPAWWRAPTIEDAERTAAMMRLDFSFWRAKWSNLQPETIGV